MVKYDNTKNVQNIKEGKYFKKADLALIIVMLFMLVGVLVLVFMPQGESVVIRVNGEVKYVYNLTDNVEISIDIDGEKSANIVVIKDGKVSMKSATCKNQICVNTGYISKVGETISCLPHNVIVEIVGKNGGGIDTVA